MFILNFKVEKLINVGVIYLNEKGSIIDNLSIFDVIISFRLIIFINLKIYQK